jgi:hypothetical protein
MLPDLLAKYEHALAITPGDAVLDKDSVPDGESLICYSAGLLGIDPENHTIQLAPKTAPKVFERIKKTRFPVAML